MDPGALDRQQEVAINKKDSPAFNLATTGRLERSTQATPATVVLPHRP